jgi:flagellar biosynthesis regulator FlbT
LFDSAGSGKDRRAIRWACFLIAGSGGRHGSQGIGVREAAGVLRGNHAQEVGEVTDSLKNLRSSLQGALNNPDVAEETRAVYTQTVQEINNFVQRAQLCLACSNI